MPIAFSAADMGFKMILHKFTGLPSGSLRSISICGRSDHVWTFPVICVLSTGLASGINASAAAGRRLEKTSAHHAGLPALPLFFNSRQRFAVQRHLGQNPRGASAPGRLRQPTSLKPPGRYHRSARRRGRRPRNTRKPAPTKKGFFSGGNRRKSYAAQVLFGKSGAWPLQGPEKSPPAHMPPRGSTVAPRRPVRRPARPDSSFPRSA